MKTIVPFCAVMLIASVSAQGHDTGETYFHIEHAKSGTYLQVESNAIDVKLHNLNQEARQQWYWAGDYLRNKNWPHGVLAFHTPDYWQQGSKIGKVVMTYWNIEGQLDLRWSHASDGTIKNKRSDRVDDIRLVPYNIESHNVRGKSDGGDGTWLGGMKWDGSDTFKWNMTSLTTKLNGFFYIKHNRNGRYLQVEGNGKDVKLRNGKSNYVPQQWYWDGDYLRNREYTGGVMAFDTPDYWKAAEDIGSVILVYQNIDHQPDLRWKYEDGFLKSKRTDGVTDIRLMPYVVFCIPRNPCLRLVTEGYDGDYLGGMTYGDSRETESFKWTLVPV